MSPATAGRALGASIARLLLVPRRTRTRAHDGGVELSWTGLPSAEYHVVVTERETKQSYRSRQRATRAVLQLPEGEYDWVIRRSGRWAPAAPPRRFRITSSGELELLKVSVPAGTLRLRLHRLLSGWIRGWRRDLRRALAGPFAGPRRFARVFEIGVFFRRVWKYCRSRTTDESTLWVAHDLYALPVTFLLAKLSGGALVYDAVELTFGRWKQPPNRLSRQILLAAERLCRRADCVLVGSPYLAKDLTSRHPGIAPVLFLNAQESAGDAARSDHIRVTAGLSPEATIVLFLGGITRDRGLDELVKAVPHFSPGLHLVIMGPNAGGAYSESLRALAADLGVADRVTILGPLGQEELVAASTSADIGISPIGRDFGNGRYNLNNKLFLYIAAGLPVVASDVEGIGSFVLSEQIGDVFDERDPKSIADCLNRLVADPERLAEIRARMPAVAAKYSWDSQREILLEAFAQVEARHP